MQKELVETGNRQLVDGSLPADPRSGVVNNAWVPVLGPMILLAKHRMFLGKCVFAGSMLGAAAALLMARTFEATTRVMPPQQSQSIASAMLTQLGPLGSIAGKDLGVRNASDLYAVLLHSDTVADDMINRFSLMQVYNKDRHVDTRRRLDALTDISVGKEGVISITVRDKDPERAAALANGYVDELRKLNQSLAVTEAGRRRVFFEREVQQAGEELAKAEQALRQTQEATGMIQLDSQSKAMIETYVTLRSQAAAKETQIEAMRSFATPENPDMVRAQQELAALRAEVARFERGDKGGSLTDVPLARVPAAGLEYVRKLREVKYREALLELLTKQYEIARIDEAKDAVIIQVLDKAQKPELQVRTWQIRLAVAVVFTLTSFLVGIISVFVVDAVRRIREDPHCAEQFKHLEFYLSHRWRSRNRVT